MLPRAGLFPPPVSLSSGAVYSSGWDQAQNGPFQGYFQVLSWTNGEDIHITFQFFYCWANTVLDNTQTHLHWHTHTHTHTPAFPLLTQTSVSSAFQLPVISSIFSRQTGSHYKRLAAISHKGSSKHCNTHWKREFSRHFHQTTSLGHNWTYNISIGDHIKNCSCKKRLDWPALLINKGKLISPDFWKELACWSKLLKLHSHWSISWLLAIIRKLAMCWCHQGKAIRGC